MVWNSSRRRVRHQASAWLATLSAVLVTACDGSTVPRTQVIVVIDATDEVRERTHQLSVAVSGGPKGQEDDWRSAGKKDFAMQSTTDWPVTVGLVPEEPHSKPGRFEVVIEAFDDEKDRAFVEKIVQSGYVKQSTRQLDVFLDLGECEGMDKARCGREVRDPAKLPEYEGPAEGDGGPSSDGGTSSSGDGGGQDTDAGAVGPDDGGQGNEDAGGGTGPKSDAGSKKCKMDAECDDGDPCNGQEQCVEGGCEDGTPLVCGDDDNPCTTVVCVAFEGCKLHENHDACDDGDPCTVGDVCDDAECVSGEPKQCNDHEVCDAESEGECSCAEGFERCADDGVCEEVGTPCECGGAWACSEDGTRECLDQKGNCAYRLGDSCSNETCGTDTYPGECTTLLTNYTRRCVEVDDGAACNWQSCRVLPI